IGRLLVNNHVAQHHLANLKIDLWEWSPATDETRAASGMSPPGKFGRREWEQLQAALHDLALDDQHNEHLPAAARRYQRITIKPKARSRLNQPEDPFEADLLKEFLAQPDKQEDNRELAAKQQIYYYGAVRATDKCLSCHPLNAEEKEALGTLK